jgi:hypothetical protein
MRSHLSSVSAPPVTAFREIDQKLLNKKNCPRKLISLALTQIGDRQNFSSARTFSIVVADNP